ncbi:hypothetical protein CKY39_12435 [Variovorax boronicumulans]|uniref:Uncharacterized protein n=2 Tax=Variovorax boronicumulans TaxID=436515 RepID=A0A250DHV0_9BURK|nr:hypothetical protein CKY39_12435 [Variovorax boronicumulans]
MLTLITKAPAMLLKKFEERIAQKEPKGKIDGWIKVTTGENAGKFTHVSKDQANKGFFEAKVDAEKKTLTFLFAPLNAEQFIYAYYHGHLTLSFISNFQDDFETATSTAKMQKPAPKSK